jgi:hypothetical protein
VRGPKEIRHINFLRALLRTRCDCDIARDRAAGLGFQPQIRRYPIKFQPTDHTLNNSYCAALLASMAYQTQAEIENQLVEHGYLQWRVSFMKTPLASAFVTEWDDTLVVAFKGSSTAREWLNNANIRLKRTPHGRIHAGFHNAVVQIGPPLLQLIRPGLLSGSKVVVTGHSRGGALASLFGFLLVLNGFMPHTIYTFGSPKVADAEFANNFRRASKKYPVKASCIPYFIAFPITLLLSVVTMVWAFALVPLKFKVQGIFRKAWGGGKSAEAKDRHTPAQIHSMSMYLQNLFAEAEKQTKICLAYYVITKRAISLSRPSPAEGVMNTLP